VSAVGAAGASPTAPGVLAERAPVDRRGEGIRSFWTAVRLGWQMEANWTDPLLFFIYSVAKPVAAALILVVMLQVVVGGAERRRRPRLGDPR